MVEREDYGPVAIIAWKHKGTVGYYDNDCYENGLAIVYLDEVPFQGGYVFCRYSSLKRVNSLKTQEFINRNKEIASSMDIRN